MTAAAYAEALAAPRVLLKRASATTLSAAGSRPPTTRLAACGAYLPPWRTPMSIDALIQGRMHRAPRRQRGFHIRDRLPRVHCRNAAGAH